MTPLEDRALPYNSSPSKYAYAPSPQFRGLLSLNNETLTCKLSGFTRACVTLFLLSGADNEASIPPGVMRPCENTSSAMQDDDESRKTVYSTRHSQHVIRCFVIFAHPSLVSVHGVRGASLRPLPPKRPPVLELRHAKPSQTMD